MHATDLTPVLIVDDDESLALTLGDILELEGFHARSSLSARSALQTAAEMVPSPAIAVVDLRLPDMDGLDLSARLHESDPELQIVILTGNASVETAIRAIRDEHCDYLVKPVQPDTLVKALRGAESRWRLARTRAALRQTEEVLKAVIDATPLPLITLDPDQNVRIWNRAAERIFGWSASEVIGRPPPVSLFGSELSPANLRRALADGGALTGMDIVRQHRSGSNLHLKLSLADVRWQGEQGRTVIALFEDITEQRSIEQQLRQAQRLDALGRLAGGVAHDFNNILAVVLGELGLAQQEVQTNEVLREALDSAVDAARRGAELTKQLLAFGRRQPAAPRSVDLTSLIPGLRRLLQRLAGDRVTVAIDMAADAWNASADAAQLEQVLTNLVANARDAMPDGGSIHISTHNQPAEPSGSGNPETAQDCVVIEVRDNGSGMSPEVLDRLFEPFFTTKGRGRGTGLGLATCYGIVQRAGGRITVQSTVGEGSTFRIHLPRADGTGKPAAVTVRSTIAQRGSERILLVEDNPDIKELAARMLRKYGYEVHVAGSAAEALEALQSGEHFHGLVTDSHLPDIRGLQLIKQCRANWPWLRALLTSGSADYTASEISGVPFIAKPYSAEQLANALRTVLDG